MHATKPETMMKLSSKLAEAVDSLRATPSSLYCLGALASTLDELDRLNLLTNADRKAQLRKLALDVETIHALALDENANVVPSQYAKDVAEIIGELTSFLAALPNELGETSD